MLLKQLKKKPNNTIPLAEKRILITQSPFLFMPLLINNVLIDLIIMKYAWKLTFNIVYQETNFRSDIQNHPCEAIRVLKSKHEVV